MIAFAIQARMTATTRLSEAGHDGHTHAQSDTWDGEAASETMKPTKSAAWYWFRGRYRLCCARRGRWAAILTLLALALAALVVGTQLKAIMRRSEESYLRRTLPLERAGMGSAAWDSFLSPVVGRQVWLFNLTNLHAVLTRGSKPHYASVGPLRFRRRSYKLDVDDSVRGELAWTDLTVFEVADAETAALLQRPIVTFNVNYLGGMAQVARINALPTSTKPGFIMPQPASISDADFNVRRTHHENNQCRTAQRSLCDGGRHFRRIVTFRCHQQV